MQASPDPKVTFSRVASEPVDLKRPSNRERSNSSRNPRSLNRSSSIDSHLSDYSDRRDFDFHFPDKSANAYSSAGKRKARPQDPPLSPQVPFSHVVRPAKYIKKQLAEKREIERRLSDPIPQAQTFSDPVKRKSSRVMANPLPSHVEVPEPEGHVNYIDIKPGPLPTTQQAPSNTTLASPQPIITSTTPEGTIRPVTVPSSERSLISTQPTASDTSREMYKVPPALSSQLQAQSRALPEVVVIEERRDPFTDPANEVIVLEPQNTNSTFLRSRRHRRRSGGDTCLLIFWCIFLPPMAVYIVGGWGSYFAWNTGLWLCLGIFAIIHAFILVFGYPEELEARRGECSPERKRLEEEQRYEEKMQKKKDKERRKLQKKRGEWIDIPES